MLNRIRSLLQSVRLPVVTTEDPESAEVLFQLGNTALGRNDWKLAEQHYRQAIAACSTHSETHANLGGLLKDRGEKKEAADHFVRALVLNPDLAPASFNLAMLHIDDKQWEQALPLLRSSLDSNQRQPDAFYWLGNVLMALGDAKGACEAYQAALNLDSKFVRARWGLAMAQLPAVPSSQKEQDAAVENFSREIKKLKSWFIAHRATEPQLAVGAQQPYYAAYIPQNHKAALAEYGVLATQLMGAWSRQANLPLPRKTSGIKCRVGIVSAHICNHSVWHALVRGWVGHLDPDKFELHLFHTGTQHDSQTQWASQRAQCLHYQLGSWTEWAKTIADGRFDVLIYPEIGMDSTTVRLSALRLARVQLASWGHPITTGLPTIDGFISAAAFEPPQAQQHYTEELITLPRLGCCYQSFGTKATAFDLTKWNIGPHESVLLCAGTPYKYTPADDALLVDIARRCSPCKIVFFKAKPEPLAQRLENRLRNAFQAANMAFDEHVRFIPWQSQASFLGLLDKAHIYLDSKGFSGFNTTMQAVERALPVVAWEGQFMRGRFASGVLREAGLDEWVAGDSAGYLERVERLSKDRKQRDHYREQIRSQRSVLFDDQESVQAFGEQLIRLT